MVDPSILRILLDYNPTEGSLTWKVRGKHLFKGNESICNIWNSKFGGTEALTSINAYGVRVGCILKQHHLAHRVAFAHYHGRWPKGNLRFINKDKSDISINNLKEI